MEIVNGTSLIAMRSIASKLVATDELGKRGCIIKRWSLLTPSFLSCSFTIAGRGGKNIKRTCRSLEKKSLIHGDIFYKIM